MSMIEVKTAELSGAALDWAVGAAVKHDSVQLDLLTVDGEPIGVCITVDHVKNRWEPSIEWAQTGPLIDHYRAYPCRYEDECPDIEEAKRFFVLTYSMKPSYGTEFNCVEGPTALVAACRAIVAAKFGDTLQVPAELVEVVQ